MSQPCLYFNEANCLGVPGWYEVFRKATEGGKTELAPIGCDQLHCPTENGFSVGLAERSPSQKMRLGEWRPYWDPLFHLELNWNSTPDLGCVCHDAWGNEASWWLRGWVQEMMNSQFGAPADHWLCERESMTWSSWAHRFLREVFFERKTGHKRKSFEKCRCHANVNYIPW